MGGAIEGRDGRGSELPDMIAPRCRLCGDWGWLRGCRVRAGDPAAFRSYGSLWLRNHVRCTFARVEDETPKLAGYAGADSRDASNDVWLLTGSAVSVVLGGTLEADTSAWSERRRDTRFEVCSPCARGVAALERETLGRGGSDSADGSPDRFSGPENLAGVHSKRSDTLPKW